MQTPEELARLIADECVEGYYDRFYLEDAVDLIRARDEAIRADERGRCSVVHATLTDEALVAELERLRAGLKALAVSGARGIDLTPTTAGYVSPQWVYDYLATLDSAWRDRVRRLLDGECQEKPIKENA